MGNDIFPHQDIFEDPLALNLVPHVPGGGAALKVMGVYNLTLFDIGAGNFCRLVPDKIVEPRNAYPGLPLMFIFVIVAYFVKVISVIKDTDADQIRKFVIHIARIL
jgi:hypothetical protein